MDLRLDGKVAIVTGSNKGIGRGIAERFAESGADVTIVYHSDEAEGQAHEVAAIVRAHARRALVAQADVGNPDDVSRLFDQHLTYFGQLDILVNNAGMSIEGAVHEIEIETWERVLRTNLYGPFFCSRLGARQMIAQGDGGRIINITSVHEEACWGNDAPYCVSKGGLRNLTRSQAIELGPHGITVNNIAPGMITTDMNQRVQEDPEFAEKAAEMIVARRAGVPADIGNMAVFLASDAGSYCTGSTHFVDGGWMLTWPPV